MPKTKRAPKTNVISFPNAKPVDYNVTIRPDGIKGDLFSHTIASNYLQKFGIIGGDKIIFTDKFQLNEIRPLSMCVMLINGDKSVRPVSVAEDGIISVFYDDGVEIYHPYELEILGVAVQLLRSLI